ncbi:MAG TPA: cell division protein ZapE [Gordonia sp. (in: high G+C Gram-positive bacteria)]|uniref:cell division protein ZapE n=1 Tax=unclassified Gordonia (in: high G+C Gram-positive bacteria) TaxID=2657482 RepID=UPI000FBDB30C|nr:MULTISPECIES: cell division protein ZapE [unclassified Gordonia (in: high G+C Gram-positive bacteria)]RUP41341.1 MAG: cell division protein ZapE [Gordonia sp. (in: high G+C Gram-positive bacteria)]HNP58123.1 cell division protein ZapE [Gordonia sp. (in: high G+C Gram-positive bacteria)]HRC50458.1 cell division protein ZapE [Gordonia sp. (in: high G+C Gram-positive bacteria)]
MTLHLCDRNPTVAPETLIAEMVPPSTFDDVSFDTYIPSPSEPSQTAALAAARSFADRARQVRGGKHGFFGRRHAPKQGIGLYLDGGFGVGKTHLLASIYHAMPGPKAFATFVELTQLVGALGFINTVERLSEHTVICIDEFELDDPGDTMLVSRLLTELSGKGVSIATTSNTLPGQLGEGRFAAQDFLREIRKLSAIFEPVRVDGPDYRHRDLPPAPDPRTDAELGGLAETTPGASLDDFTALCEHLSTLHPSKYKALVDGVSLVCVSDVSPATDQSVALRLVVLADRLYDAGIPLTTSGCKLDEIFTEEMLAGGYRKKYLRATSRLLALSRFAEADAA